MNADLFAKKRRKEEINEFSIFENYSQKYSKKYKLATLFLKKSILLNLLQTSSVAVFGLFKSIIKIHFALRFTSDINCLELSSISEVKYDGR